MNSISANLNIMIKASEKASKVLIRDFNDPFKVHRSGRGFLNIIDLANKYSCPFISTEDLGEVFENGDRCQAKHCGSGMDSVNIGFHCLSMRMTILTSLGSNWMSSTKCLWCLHTFVFL